MSSPPSWEFAAGKILTICRTHKAEAHGASHPLRLNTAKENLHRTVHNRADNSYRKGRTFSLNQRPVWRERHFLLSAHHRVDADWLTSRAPDRHPIRAAQRIAATTTRVRTAVRSWRDLPLECMQLPASNFQRSDFSRAHRALRPQMMHLEMCAAVSPGANVRVPTNASRSSG